MQMPVLIGQLRINFHPAACHRLPFNNKSGVKSGSNIQGNSNQSITELFIDCLTEQQSILQDPKTKMFFVFETKLRMFCFWSHQNT